MNFEIDMDDSFAGTFCNAGASNAHCNCGREHYAMLAYDEWEDTTQQEIDEIIKDIEKLAKDDEMSILDYEVDCFDLMEFGNRVFVYGCPCEGWRPYMNFMIDQRRDIAEFLVNTSKEVKRIQSYEKVMDILEKEYES